MIAEDQAETIAFLEDPASYAGQAEAVERIETHISVVFLGRRPRLQAEAGRALQLSRFLHGGKARGSLRRRAGAEPAHRARSLSRDPRHPARGRRPPRLRGRGCSPRYGRGHAALRSILPLRSPGSSGCPHPGPDARARRSDRGISPRRRGRPGLRRPGCSRRNHQRQ